MYDEGLETRPDPEILAAANREDRFIVTQDLKLADSRTTPTYRGLMLVMLAEPSALRLVARVCWVFEHEDSQTWKDALVIVTDSKVRVRGRAGDQ